MCCLKLLVASLLSLGLTTSPYQAVVVDATTSRPLAGVHIIDLAQHTGLVTDAAGRFTLPGPTAHFRVHSLGYAALEATRATQAGGVPDTLRLLPQALLLAEVRVRPAQPLVLSSVVGKGSGRHGGLITPGSQYAVLFQAPADAKAVVVQHITLQLRHHRPTAGRVRIRLVGVAPGPTPLPSPHDLIPVPALYTAAELAAKAGQPLTIDLADYTLRLPVEGLFVLVEGLPTQAGDRFVRMENMGTVVTATSQGLTRTPMQAFASLEWAESPTTISSFVRHGQQTTWQPHNQATKAQRADNLNISLGLAAE